MLTEEQKTLARRYLLENLHGGLNCSESTWNAMLRSGIVDLPKEYSALASGLNGGVGSSGYTCGALTGALMALGFYYSQSRSNEKGDREIIDKKRFNACVAEFESKAGTCRCQDVIDDNGGYYQPTRQEKCASLMQLGVEMAIKYIDMSEEELNKLSWSNNVFGW